MTTFLLFGQNTFNQSPLTESGSSVGVKTTECLSTWGWAYLVLSQTQSGLDSKMRPDP